MVYIDRRSFIIAGCGNREAAAGTDVGDIGSFLDSALSVNSGCSMVNTTQLRDPWDLITHSMPKPP